MPALTDGFTWTRVFHWLESAKACDATVHASTIHEVAHAVVLPQPCLLVKWLGLTTFATFGIGDAMSLHGEVTKIVFHGLRRRIECVEQITTFQGSLGGFGSWCDRGHSHGI